VFWRGLHSRLQIELQFGLGLRFLLRQLALLWSFFSHSVCMLGGLQPPTICPCSHFPFSLSPLLALCYPFHGLLDHVLDARPPQPVVLMAGIPLLLSLLHPHRHCQPLCLLMGFQGFHHLCTMSLCLVQLRQFLCLLSYHPRDAAPAVAGGRLGLTARSQFSVLVSSPRLKSGCACSLRGDGCCRCRHPHCHIHRRIAPPVSRFSIIQVTLPAHSQFGYHFCQARLRVLIVAYPLAVAVTAKPLCTPTPLRGFLCALSSCCHAGAGTLSPKSI